MMRLSSTTLLVVWNVILTALVIANTFFVGNLQTGQNELRNQGDQLRNTLNMQSLSSSLWSSDAIKTIKGIEYRMDDLRDTIDDLDYSVNELEYSVDDLEQKLRRIR
jgi:hypothetical protein